MTTDVATYRTRLRGLVVGGRVDVQQSPALRGDEGAALLTDLPRVDARQAIEPLMRHGIHLLPCLLWQDGEALAHQPLPATRLDGSVWQELAQQSARWGAARATETELGRSVRHHLAAPLHSLSSLLDTLQEDRDPGARFHRMLALAQISALGLAGSADALATLMLVGQAKLECSELDLSQLCAQRLVELAASQPPSADVQISPDMKVWADPATLRLALQALLSNALKFSAKTERPRVQVRLLQGRTHDLICVEDNGVGFAVEHAQGLFQPFERIHLQSEFPGLGLGLALVQAVAHRHGGWAWCDRGEPGCTAFVLALPRAPNG